MSTKNSSDTIGNRTRDLPTSSAVPQPTAPTACPRNSHIEGDQKVFVHLTIAVQSWGAQRIFNHSVYCNNYTTVLKVRYTTVWDFLQFQYSNQPAISGVALCERNVRRLLPKTILGWRVSTLGFAEYGNILGEYGHRIRQLPATVETVLWMLCIAILWPEPQTKYPRSSFTSGIFRPASPSGRAV